jgi:hypothetical protein
MPQWTADPDGLGGRLELSLDIPASRDTSVVTVVAENALGGRSTQTQAVQVRNP